MSAIKERILGAVTVMSDEDAASMWSFIVQQFGFPEDDATEEEIEIMRKYRNGDDEYQPYTSHNDLKKELGLA